MSFLVDFVESVIPMQRSGKNELNALRGIFAIALLLISAIFLPKMSMLRKK